MISKVLFLSKSQAQTVPGNGRVVVVSIRAPDEPVKLKSGFRDVLALEFDDYDPQRDGLGAARVAKLFSSLHAERLKAWIAVHHSALDKLTVLVHCQAGISRSAAVAWWIHKAFGAALLTRYPAGYLNRHVLCMLDKAIDLPEQPQIALRMVREDAIPEL